MSISEQIKECKESDIPYVVYDFDFSEKAKNPDYEPPDIQDDKEWVVDLYKNILNSTVDDQDSGLLYWLQEINKGRSRQSILNYFRNVAAKDNKEKQSTKMDDFINKNPNKKILFVLKESLGDAFICTSLFPSIKERYPDHDLYVATNREYIDVFKCNEYVDEVLPYDPMMESELAMIGQGNRKKLFDVYMNPAVSTQRQLNYLSNSELDVLLEY